MYCLLIDIIFFHQFYKSQYIIIIFLNLGSLELCKHVFYLKQNKLGRSLYYYYLNTHLYMQT